MPKKDAQIRIVTGRSKRRAALDRISKIEIDALDSTASGRRVALRFHDGQSVRGTTIYLEDIAALVDMKQQSGAVAKGMQTTYIHGISAISKGSPVVHERIRGTPFGKRDVYFHRVMSIEASASAVKKSSHKAPAKQAEPAKQAFTPLSIKKFVLYFFDHIRRIVCPRKGGKMVLSTGTTSVITGAAGTLASWLTAHFSMALGIAGALASAILVLIARATKGAFCDTAADIAKELIRKA